MNTKQLYHLLSSSTLKILLVELANDLDYSKGNNHGTRIELNRVMLQCLKKWRNKSEILYESEEYVFANKIYIKWREVKPTPKERESWFMSKTKELIKIRRDRLWNYVNKYKDKYSELPQKKGGVMSEEEIENNGLITDKYLYLLAAHRDLLNFENNLKNHLDTPKRLS